MKIEIENNIVVKYNDKEENVLIDDGIVEIASLAFANSNIRTIKLPNSLRKIGEFAFEGCKLLQEIYIPANVEFIGPGVLSNCPNLKKIIVDEKNKNFTSLNSNILASIDIGFSDDENIINVISGCQNSIIPEGVTSIGNRAFYKQTMLNELILPNTVELIEEEAFYDCANLKTIHISKSVKNIMINSFVHCCSIEKITVDKDNLAYTDGGVNAIINKERSLLLLSSINTKVPDYIKQIGDFAFNSSNIKEIIIPEGIIMLPSYVFENCHKLTKVSLPSTLKIILMPFSNNDNKLSISFNGTIEQWKNVNAKCSSYGNKTNYLVKCLDGVVSFEN